MNVIKEIYSLAFNNCVKVTSIESRRLNFELC